MTATAAGSGVAADGFPDAAAIAARYGLRQAGVRPPFWEYVRSVWRRREFARVLATSNVYAENQNTYLGQFWAVLNPAMNSLVYVLIFGLLIKGANPSIENKIAFIVIGTFIYRFFSDGVTGSAKSITSNMTLVRSLHFPRAVLPISAVIAQLASLLPALFVMMVIVLVSGFFPGMEPAVLSWTWLMLPVAIVLTYIFTTGLGFMFARAVAALPDVGNLLPFFLRVLMYGSGVMFSITGNLKGHPTLSMIMENQPVAIYLDLARQCLLGEVSIPFMWSKWVIGLGWAVLFFVVGFWYFWRDEARYGRE